MASIADLARRFKATSPTAGCMFRISGNGASNPTIISSYNVTSITRTGAGTYRVTLKQSTVYGVGITSLGVLSAFWKIVPTGSTDSFEVTGTVISATQVDIEVYALTVSGSKIVRTLYDFVSTDFIHVNALVSAGDGTLPEA